MSFRFTVPGQPLSANHAHQDVYLTRGDKRIRTRAKTPEATAYQLGVKTLASVARPTGFAPTGYIRVVFDFYLRRDIDCDNMIKLIDDAIAWALDVNDRWFLPCVRSKTVNSKADPHVDIEIQEYVSSVPDH